MEHYAPWRRTRSICSCLVAGSRGGARAARGAARARRRAARGRATASLLDSFDGRLRAAGLRAERPAGRGAAALDAARARRAGAARRGRARAPRHLVAGAAGRAPVRERLARVLEERALLPAVRVRSAVQPLAVRQRRRARRSCGWRSSSPRRSPAAAGGSPLAPRLSVRPVLGYDARPTSARCACCATSSGSSRRSAPLYDEAVLGGRRAPGRRVRPSRASSSPRGTRTDAAGGARARGGCARSPRPTSRARSTTSTPSSCTTCASRSGARARCCASSRTSTTRSARAHLRDELKWAQALTGPVRDLDVQLLEWHELAAHARPTARAAELEPLRALLARRRARELREAAARPARQALRGGAARPGARWRRAAARPTSGRTPRAPIEAVAGERIREGLPRGWCATAAGSTTTARPRRCTTCASAARSCATCSSCSAARSRAEVVKPMVVDAQGPPGGARPLPGPRGAGRDAARRCATSSPPSRAGPPR